MRQQQSATRTVVSTHARICCTSASVHILCQCFFGVKTALLGQFSPTGAHHENCGSLVSIVVAIHGSRRLKRYRRRARTNRTSNGRGEGRAVEATGYHVQHKVCLHVEVARNRWVVVSASTFLSARRQCQNSTTAPVAEQRQRLLLGFGDLFVMGMQSNSFRGLSAFSFDLWFLKALLLGMQMWKPSCLVLHVLVACTLVELHQAFRRRKPQREHIRCLYRPGIKEANKPRYRLLRRKLWSVRFFPLAVFPTISQTLAAEAAISMEAPMGNAKDAAEERLLRRKGEKTKVRAPRRRPSSWRRQKRRPWRSIWGCSVAKEALANRARGKQVQFPGAPGLEIPFPPLYTAQIREEHAYCGSQGPLYLSCSCSWRIVRKVRTARTFRGSGCRGGLGGKLHLTCMERANMFLSFSSFPPDSALRPRFWTILFGSILYHPRSFGFSGSVRCQEHWECQAKFPRSYWWHALWACSPLGSGAACSSQGGREKMVAGLQRQKRTSRRPRRGVQGLGGRSVCRRAGAVQLACRAKGLATACVGADRRDQQRVFLISWIVVISDKNSTKNSRTTLWDHVQYIGVCSPSQGAASAISTVGGTR